MSIRDPNAMAAGDWSRARSPLTDPALKQTIKKNTTQDPKDQSTKDLSPTNRFMKTEEHVAPKNPAGAAVMAASIPAQGLISKEHKKSFELRAEETAKIKAEQAKKEELKPETRDWKPLGVVDFTGKGMVRGVGNTKNFRWQLGKQVQGALGKGYDRNSRVIKNITNEISSSGTMSVRGVKRAIRNSGLTTGQQRRMFDHLGI